MRTHKGFELTYCTNIHPAKGWRHVLENVRHHTRELRSRLNPQGRFGVGLRLSNEEALELLSDTNLDQFADYLKDSGLYVALVNGFPFGLFHQGKLKDAVFAPDWHTQDRVQYTLRLIEILSRLLPTDLDGGVSTCPLSYKRWDQSFDWDLLVKNIIRIAESLFELQREEGQDIHLDIEPEPDGLVETAAEFVRFFEKLLYTGAPEFAKTTQVSAAQAERALRQHIGFCYDLCHSAVEAEDPRTVMDTLKNAGIRVGRVQISSAVKVATPSGANTRGRLSPLADSVYLHQVIGDKDRYADLEQALAQTETTRSSVWRIHYHVPLFLESYGDLDSTQSEVRSALAQITPADTKHLEIETYTWSVLPADLKLDLIDSIEREYRWVMSRL